MCLPLSQSTHSADSQSWQELHTNAAISAQKMCTKTRLKCSCGVLFVFSDVTSDWCLFLIGCTHTDIYIKKKRHRHRRSLDTLLSSYKRSAWERKGQSVTYDKGHHQGKKQHFSRLPGALQPEESGKAGTQIAPDSRGGDGGQVSVRVGQWETEPGDRQK